MEPQARRNDFFFLVAVFGVIAIVIGVTFIVYSRQPAPPTAPTNLVFAGVVLASGNASFAVRNTTGGPYNYAGFRMTLLVNDRAGGPAALGPNNSAVRVAIGPNAYRVAWSDANGDGAVDTGDSFLVSGDGGPLPALSYYELDLQWENQWTAKATWSTP